MQPLNFDTPVIDELGKVHQLKEYSGGGGGGDISDAIPVFTTDDTIQNPTEKVSMPLFQSGNALKDLLRWISKGFQNIRYLLKFTEDISTDLNTTIEQVEDINTNLVKEWSDISVARAGEYYWHNNLIWKALVDTANTPTEGSEWHNVKVMDEVSALNSNLAKIKLLYNNDLNIRVVVGTVLNLLDSLNNYDYILISYRCDSNYTGALVDTASNSFRIAGTFIEYSQAGIMRITFNNNNTNLTVSDVSGAYDGKTYSGGSLTEIKSIIGIKF